MIGTSTGEWIVIRLSIAFFRHLLSIYAALLIISPLILPADSKWGSRLSTAIATALLCESIFYLVIYRPFNDRLRDKAVYPTPLSASERAAVFRRCFDNVESIETYLSGWFLGADPKDIKRENVAEFLLWAFFERDMLEAGEKIDDGLAIELEGYVTQVEKRLGKRLEPGRGPATSLRLTVDAVKSEYRPLLWYLIVALVDQFTHAVMRWKGFEYYAASQQSVFPPRPQQYLSRRQSPVTTLGYWYSPHQKEDKTPLIFFHGIGIGLLVYMRFLAALIQAESGIGVIAVELMPISFRLTSPPPTKAQFLEQMTTIIDHHRWSNFGIVSHSYGSVLVTHMLSSLELQKRIRSLVLIDPVTILLHQPDVAYHFTRRPPTQANEWQLWYFASTDPGVAHCLGRHFFWRENIVWKEDLLKRAGVDADDPENTDRKVAVFMSGRDLITNPAVIAQYLGKEGQDSLEGQVEVTVFPGLDHAQVFDNPKERAQVLDLTKAYSWR